MRVAVLGAGLQGACVAFELASRGVQVDLYDKNDLPVTQASALNEAKIHLGFFYGKDSSLKTARLVAQGAVTFAPLLRRWLGDDIDRVPVSPPYYYAVTRDSILPAEQVERHFKATSKVVNELIPGVPDYFGVDCRDAPYRMQSYDEFFDPRSIVAAFRTPEIAISAASLAAIVRSHLFAEPDIRCILGATVRRVTIRDSGIEVGFERAGESLSEGYDQVVNALWDGRLAIDATAGIMPQRPWSFRLKYDVHVRQAPFHSAVPSVTLVLGAFGDVVRYDNGEMCLSWYPVGMKKMTSELAPPAWPPVLDGEAAEEVRSGTFAALSKMVPGLTDLAVYCLSESEVQGAVIFAWGATDISDPASELHTRFDIGPRSYGRYHSIDTGKLTTAPLFGKMMADLILAS
jgi:hypothetical protein